MAISGLCLCLSATRTNYKNQNTKSCSSCKSCLNIEFSCDRDRRALGWKVLIVWECHLRRPDRLLQTLTRFLSS